MIRPASLIRATLIATAVLFAAPGRAIIVYDPSNYAQNALAAARALEQVNNQVRGLQNQATMLVDMAHNLGRVDFPELQQLRTALGQAQTLLGSGQALSFRVEATASQFDTLFPALGGSPSTSGAMLAAARARLSQALGAYRQAITVQSQIVGNVASDSETLATLSSRSQSAEGALSAAQAGNQLAALVAKQQIQIQQLMAAQYRADSLERAERAQGAIDAAAATARFLGSGTAYTPH